jgi:uncharacterized protein (TIGR03032 family)
MRHTQARTPQTPNNPGFSTGAVQPFQMVASGQIDTLLRGFGLSLAIASYQASSVIIVSPTVNGLSVLPRAFDKPMSLASADTRMAIAARNELILLAASSALAAGYPQGPGKYAQLWLPRTLRYTGEIDLHDIAFSGDAVLGIATRLSCIARLDDRASLTPIWQPPFVSDITPDDRCHLNGLALDSSGKPAFVTALGTTDTPEGWRPGRTTGGVLLSVQDNAVVLGGLSMPHSPQLIHGSLYVLNSGTGEVLLVDPARGTANVLARLPGYLRGLAAWGDVLFVGLSRLRDRHGTGAGPLPVEADGGELQCGVVALDRHSGRVLGGVSLLSGAEEVSDISLLVGPGLHGILSHTDPMHRAALALPTQGYWARTDG